MRSSIVLFVVFLFCLRGYGQQFPYTPLQPTVFGVHQLRTKNDSATHIPHKNTLRQSTSDTTPQLFAVGTQLWMFANSQYIPIGSGGGNILIGGGVSDVTDVSSDQVNARGISGPISGSELYTPDSSGTVFLKNKGIVHLVRNNVPLMMGSDYFFNTSSGTIQFTEPIGEAEDLEMIYTGTPNAASSDTSKVVVGDTSTFQVKFGIITLSTDLSTSQKVEWSDTLGVDYIRTSIELSTYNGSSNYLNNMRSKGKKCVCNLNWKDVGRDASGNKVPNPFVKSAQYAAYDAKLNQVLSDYGDVIEIAVLENEPTTKHFYIGSVVDYIALLAHAIPIVHAHGEKVADGCIHTGYVQNIMNGHLNDVNTRQVDTIINAYPTLALDYTNVHTHGPNQPTYNENLVGIANYIRSHNGSKPLISNEYGVDGAYPSLIQSMVAKMKLAHMIYSIALDAGSGGGGGQSFHVIGTTVPNDIGKAYRSSILYP